MYLHVVCVVLVAGQTLLQLTDIEELILSDAPTQFSNESNMLSDVARKFPELRIVLDKALHVCYRVQLCISMGLGSKLLNVVLCILTKVSEIQIHVLLEERVLILR